MAPPEDGEDESPEEPADPAEGGSPPAGGDAGRGDKPRSDAHTPGDTEADAAAAVPAGSRAQTLAISSLAIQAPSLLERVTDGVIEAVRQFSFPLFLAVGVGAFLLMQSRIDRKDPKLAIAPVDARDDLVVFD